MFGIFENTTVFKGRLKFKFEKYPEYKEGGIHGTILNKIILDLGFIKFVSRIKTIQIDNYKLELINKYTGGLLVAKQLRKNEKYDGYIKYDFVTLDGKYIGNSEKAWWYFKNNLLVYPKYHNKVAIAVKDIKRSMEVPYNSIKDKSESIATEQIEANNIIGFYGYSHRGGQIFKIGDRIFDERYEPKKEDYPEWQWEGWNEEFKKNYTKGDDFDRDMIYNEGIKSIIPFKFRGKEVILNWNDALQSALNISNYLS